MAELDATLLTILDDVAAGIEVDVVRDGRSIARSVPVDIGRGATLRGKFAGIATTAATDDELFSTGLDWDVAGT